MHRRKPKSPPTIRQRYLPMAYAAAWITAIVSFCVVQGITLSGANWPDETTGQVVYHRQKSSAVYITAAQDRLDLWAKTVMILAIVVCALGPEVAFRAAWLESPKDKPPRLWD